MQSTKSNDGLQNLLKKTQALNVSQQLPDELSFLIDAFLSTHPSDERSKAYLALSTICQEIRHSASGGNTEQDAATAVLVKVFGPPVVERLTETDEIALQSSITFLTALFQIDNRSGTAILQQDGVLENIMDSVELSPSAQLCHDVAHLLGQACGHKSSRAIISPQCIEWLEISSRHTRDASLKTAAAVALVKLSIGIASDDTKDDKALNWTGNLNKDLVEVMKAATENGQPGSSAVVDAVEGLAYLTVDPLIKETLSNDTAFLKKLFSLIPVRKATPLSTTHDLNSAMLYGVLLIISNMSSYRPRLTEEQTQLKKLKQMASVSQDSKGLLDEPSVFDDDQHVKLRVHRLVDAGVLPVFASAISFGTSVGIRTNIAKALLNIVEDQGNRGKVLQNGGARVLGVVIKLGLSASSSTSIKQISSVDPIELEPIQALAKLTITASPVQVFGPNIGAIYDALRPFSLLLQHPSAKLLQRFEAMMALTNLASHSPEIASRIASADGLINKVELLLLGEHTLVRRAAMELICNLIVGSDSMFERYGGGEYSEPAKAKLQVVLALCDVDDLLTRLAASGALATLTSSPDACKALLSLQLERRHVLPILTQLIDPTAIPAEEQEEARTSEGDTGLAHRGVICARNFFLNVTDKETRKQLSEEAKKTGLLKALASIKQNEGLLQPVAEILKVLQ